MQRRKRKRLRYEDVYGTMSLVPIFCRLRCPECNTTFPAEIMRGTGSGGFLESDLCYRAGSIFVYPFFVVVCPGCRFAANYEEFDYLGEFPQYSDYHPIKRALGQFLREQRALFPGSEKYRLAVISLRRKKAAVLRLAHLHLRGSWCARNEGDGKAERYHQEQAVRLFRDGLAQGCSGVETAMLTYLVGELYRRLGRFAEAEAVFEGVREDLLPDWLRPGFR
ncbi:MAG: DUF2225 domain-containing protein, partial [Bacillota bacterium]